MKIRQNPDKALARELLLKVRENGGYCPCSLVKNEDTKCPCKAFREQEHGSCHCGLYYKE